MILDVPEWAMGWYHHDDKKDINVVDKYTPKEVVKMYKEFDKEYFNYYRTHFFDFDEIKGKDKGIIQKIKSWL